jgi:rifampicin phosphotransferase
MNQTPYDDGRWTIGDHAADDSGALWCRGNVGEVFPNVVTPLSASLYRGAMDRGQAAAAVEWGLLTDRQVAGFRPDAAWLTGVFGGYLYGNVTAARSAVARSPGLTVELVDTQMFGLSDAPPHRRGKGERDPRAAMKTVTRIARSMRRPDDSCLRTDQADVARYAQSQPDIASASNDELIAVARSMAPWTERMMHHLLSASSAAGISRSLLERTVASLGDAGLENRLTAGLGTIESAEPPRDAWRLGRLVAGDATLTALFDEGLDDLDARLRASAGTTSFVTELDEFSARHGARGPDEWELASPTWGSDPSIALAMIDRLRHALEDRDPVVVSRRLAVERDSLVPETRSRLPRWRRPLFDIALRATTAHAPQREATKAAFVRALYPTRRALAELAHRSRLEHADFFLLTIDEVPGVMGGGGPSNDVVAERRDRRDQLQRRIPPFWFQSPLSAPGTWALRDETRPDSAARSIVGLGVCSGIATGTARIVRRPDQPGDLGPGDILVAPITDPAWTPLFLAVAGVVVDVGAQQSHAAIVSRELGIPAVVSATGASATIPDGTRITVDGTRGLVTVHADDA